MSYNFNYRVKISKETEGMVLFYAHKDLGYIYVMLVKYGDIKSTVAYLDNSDHQLKNKSEVPNKSLFYIYRPI